MNNKDLLNIDLKELISGKDEKFITGFCDLDTLGLYKGELIVIGGRPAMGKSTLMQNLFINSLSNGYKCGYFSLEMSNEQFLKKVLCQMAKVSADKKFEDLNDDNFGKMTIKMNELSQYKFDILDKINITVEDIENYISKENPDIIFIDYLQLIAYNKSKRDRVHQITDIMTTLREMAKKYNVTIFVSSQLSRAVENRFDKRPMLSDLREAGSIEDIADLIIFLYRESYYHAYDVDNALYNRNIAELIVAKNKFGTTATINLNFNQEYLNFENIG